MALIGFAIIWRARSFSVRAWGLFMTHIEVNIHIITCCILDKFANLVVSFAAVFRMSRNASLRELHLWLAQIGKGMWFECEQLFLSVEWHPKRRLQRTLPTKWNRFYFGWHQIVIVNWWPFWRKVFTAKEALQNSRDAIILLSLIHIWRCRRS